MFELIMWGFFYVALHYDVDPAGLPDGTQVGLMFVTAEQCERQRQMQLEITDQQGRQYSTVSETCYTLNFTRDSAGVMAMRMGEASAPSVALNRQCVYDVAAATVDPLFPTAGLTGIAKKTQQAKRIAARRELIADIHACPLE